MSRTYELIKLMRPHQYIKNLFILLPIFFSSSITDTTLLYYAFTAVVAFSFVASGIYILNDFRDIEDDKRHPQKKKRPLASGSITKAEGLGVMTLLIIIGIALMSLLSLAATAVLIIYICLNVAYSFYLKHVAILDITIIAIGFVLRLYVGSLVTDIPLSKWIVIMTFLLALFLALAKRRDDVLIYLDTGRKTRKVVDGYNLQFLDTAMAIMASVVIVAYTIYTTSTHLLERVHGEYLYLTVLFVIVGIMRYLQIAIVKEESGAPTLIVIKDNFIRLTLLGWVMTLTWILY